MTTPLIRALADRIRDRKYEHEKNLHRRSELTVQVSPFIYELLEDEMTADADGVDLGVGQLCIHSVPVEPSDSLEAMEIIDRRERRKGERWEDALRFASAQRRLSRSVETFDPVDPTDPTVLSNLFNIPPEQSWRQRRWTPERMKERIDELEQTAADVEWTEPVEWDA